MRTLGRFLTLPHQTAMLLLAAAALQVGARLVLRTCGLPPAVRLANSLGARFARARDLPTLGWALAASAARVGGTCLTQALAARALGAPASGAARVVIGVRRRAGALEFHAWTEIDGTSLPATTGGVSFAPMMVWS